MSENVAGDDDQEFEGLIRGAQKIADLLNLPNRRAVYHLAARSRLPVFKLGSMLCARRKVLLAFITEQEQRRPSSQRTQNHPADFSANRKRK